MPNNDSKAAIAQNGMLDAAAQLQQLYSDPVYLRLVKEMGDTVAKEALKYVFDNGRLTRVGDEWIEKRLAELKMMLDNYVEQNYPLLHKL